MSGPRDRRSFVLPFALPFMLAWLVGSAGCGDIDGGSEPFPGTVMYVSPQKTYHLRLLEPPWLPVTLQSETVFLVPSSTLTVSVASKEADALYSLHVTPRPGNALSSFQTSASAQSPPWDLGAKQEVTVAGGQAGLDISWQESATVFHRQAHIDGDSAATSFELRFTGKKSLADDPMILQMILSFGPGPG